MSRLCKCDDLQETGDTAATGYIGLEYVDSAVRKKVTAIVERKDIFTRRDLQPCRSLAPNSVQTCWIVGGDRLLEMLLRQRSLLFAGLRASSLFTGLSL